MNLFRAVLSISLLVLAADPLEAADVTASPGDEAIEIPRPDLTGMEPVVRHEIEALRESFESLRQQPRTPAEQLAETSGRLAAVYHAHEFHLAAEAAYRQALSAAPRDPRWSYYLGILYQDLGEIEQAIASYDKLLAAYPEDLASLIRAGDLRLRLGRGGEARLFFERALALSENSAAAFYGLGRSAVVAKDPGAAVTYFERALEQQPEASAVRYPLGLAYRELGDLEAARRHLGQRGDVEVDFPDPLLDQLARIAKVSAVNVVLTQAAQFETVSVRELAGYAVAHLAETAGAIETLTAAAQASGRSGVARARLYYVVATLLRLEKATSQAVERLRTAVELAPGLVAVRLELANSLARAGGLEEAVTHYSAVLEVDPEHPAALEGRATTQIQLGRDRLAVTDFRRLAEIAPRDGRPRLRLAMVLHRLGDKEPAASIYREALARELTAPDEALARGNLAALMLEGGELEAAVEQLASAWRLDPEQVELEQRLADALGRIDRFDDAARHYAHVVEAQPDNEAARIGEVSALVFARRYEAARSRLEAGHLAAPDSPVLAHLLARFLAAAPTGLERDGERALDLAKPLFDQRRTLLHGETLAMALAQNDRFEEAIALQSDLLKAAEARQARRAVDRLRANLDLYRASRVCCAQEDFVVLLPTAEGGAGAG